MVAGLAVCMFIQLKFLNNGLRLFDILFMLPIYQAFWITGATVNGILFFEVSLRQIHTRPANPQIAETCVLTVLCVLLAPCSLVLGPCSLLLAPWSLLLAPCSLLLAPCSFPRVNMCQLAYANPTSCTGVRELQRHTVLHVPHWVRADRRWRRRAGHEVRAVRGPRHHGKP